MSYLEKADDEEARDVMRVLPPNKDLRDKNDELNAVWVLDTKVQLDRKLRLSRQAAVHAEHVFGSLLRRAIW